MEVSTQKRKPRSQVHNCQILFKYSKKSKNKMQALSSFKDCVKQRPSQPSIYVDGIVYLEFAFSRDDKCTADVEKSVAKGNSVKRVLGKLPATKNLIKKAQLTILNEVLTSIRCREWERIRRNKFNDTITKLGEVAKAVNKSIFPEEDVDDTQCPKVEIIQKAIICLTKCSKQITHLKAEILAIHVQIDADKSKKVNLKDASTQVYCGVTKKHKDGKYVKLLMVKKSNSKSKEDKPKPQIPPIKKLPVLLPRTNNKKAPENTIVVLPAAPYIFPPRPLLFPTVPPAFVLVDHNLQPVNKASVPVVGRNNGDITKTTMVNILPISAYSHPLSAVKSKKSNIKLKTEANKKVNKKSKSVVNLDKESLNKNDVIKNSTTATSKENESLESSSKQSDATNKDLPKAVKEDDENQNQIIAKEASASFNKDNNLQKKIILRDDKVSNSVSDENMKGDKNKENQIPTVLGKLKLSESIDKQSPILKIDLPTSVEHCDSIKLGDENKSSKKSILDNKDKENKLPSIMPLVTPLCDNVVDAGNARLELAEEFLATSPTAAFLMSFPLVSGNRADSPAEDHNHTTQGTSKENQRRTELAPITVPHFEKTIDNDGKVKSADKHSVTETKDIEQQKCVNNVVIKDSNTNDAMHKPSNAVTMPSVSSENPFLNLSMPSLISTACTLGDATFGLDFDCNIHKSIPSQSTSYASSNNFFYKSDPFGTVKNTIYSTSSITSGHEFNSLGLYPCAMEKYSSKNKPDYTSVDDNIMKIGSSRLTYDIDLGWSHKGLDFVNCTTNASTFNKDTLLTTTSTPYTSSYNPFNPDFHVPLTHNSNKKDSSNKVPSSFTDTITSFYSQSTNLWNEDIPFYTNSNITKALTTKPQNYPVLDHIQNVNANMKVNTNKHYDTKMTEPNMAPVIKTSNNAASQQNPEKYTKKSPSKTHINWMTSEIRPAQNNCNAISHPQIKETHKSSYNHIEQSVKKQNQNEGNYFPITMHNYSAQTAQDEFQVWPASARPLGTTEVSIDPPPINLPTLVGDLALGPHDKNKKADVTNRAVVPPDIQNCGNFLSVTQLMNRSTDNMHSRFQVPNVDASKTVTTKPHVNNFNNEIHPKGMSHQENMSQSYYTFNDPKIANSYNSAPQFIQSKSKSNNKIEKPSKTHKNNYSTEALLRGANCTQKIQEINNSKFMMPPQKYNDYNASQDTAVAQVSHFPPILDYSDNGYASQQHSGTTLYNTTTNTISNSFYTNFMPGSSNLMSSNYASGPFSGEFIDYNQTAECNYGNHKYEELKMRNNTNMFPAEKVSTNYKSTRRESASKHKLECSKKESNKKYQSKKAKISNEIEEWHDPSHALWQNKSSAKKHTNLVADELPFPNYVGNQMPTQYQSDFFNSHLMPSNMQSVGHNVDRSLASFPVTSRANFNLSTIFPEITMKVQ